MKFFLILLICLPAFAAESDLAKLSREVKQRKEALKVFKEKVSLGDKCQLRDYDCFSREVLSIVKGHTEELIEAPNILEPFYERSVKEGFPPCSDTCEHTMLASHLKLYMDYLDKYNDQDKVNSRIPAYPTISSVKVRTYMDLSAFYNLQKSLTRIEMLMKKLDFGKVTKSELANKKLFETKFNKLNSGQIFSNSILCRLQQGDPVNYELSRGSSNSGKRMDDSYQDWFGQFMEKAGMNCVDRSPLVYRGTDKATKDYYREQRDMLLSIMNCDEGNFSCVRKHLREVGIHYAEDVEVVAKKLITFLKSSRVQPCDDTCKAQSLVRMIQTWITYLSTYDREKLASTLDWKEFPEAKYLTITEDVEMYQSLKKILTPIITTYGKIDPQNIKEIHLRSELRSVAKDLSDFASGRMLKDSVICTMEPWTASYDKYLSPYKDKAKNKKFEEAFVEFKSNVCKI